MINSNTTGDQQMNLKWSDRALLDIALQQLGTNKQTFKRELYRTLLLRDAKCTKKIDRTHKSEVPETGVKHTSTSYIYETDVCVITATRYGRIQNVKSKRVVKPQVKRSAPTPKPSVVYKRKKKLA
jgi:hypothetical protein